MSYYIKKGTGKKPFLIVNQKTGVVVGRSNSLDKANRSAGYRMAADSGKKDIKTFKRKVDNKLNGYGETDLKKRIVKINKSKKKNKKGEIIDSIVHEKSHILHPKMHEKNIQKRTTRVLSKMNRKQKQRHYNLFRT
mgnify:CR=1 FL=1